MAYREARNLREEKNQTLEEVTQEVKLSDLRKHGIFSAATRVVRPEEKVALTQKKGRRRLLHNQCFYHDSKTVV